MILGIDTSIGTAVAVVDADGTTLSSVVSSDTRGHAEVIGDLLRRALADAGATPADITAVAAGMGPGPFTGLRVGIASARAFALGRGVPVVAVASHDAAALARIEASDGSAAPAEGERFAVVTDARRRELALSVYRVVDGAPVRVVDPYLVPRVSTEPVEPFGLAASELPETDAVSAEALARLAAARLRGGTADTAASEPLYLRAPDVTPPAAPKRVGS